MANMPINPSTLIWAREVCNTSAEDLAKAAGVKPERYIAFETGDATPTFRQLGLIADRLDRTLGFFFTSPPSASDIPETADFRGRTQDQLPPVLLREMRRAEQYRDTMLELGGHPERNLKIAPINWSNITERAAELRASLGLNENFVPANNLNSKALNFWRSTLEEHGIAVFQATRVSLKTFRGLSIYHSKLPIIVLNGADSAGGRIFTLFHEIAHLINRTSGLCALEDNIDEEAIANNFAANFLLPEAAVRENLRDLHNPQAAAGHIAQHFKVSLLAAAVRLRRMEIIDDEDLAAIRRTSDQNWEQAQEAQKKKGGFVQQWQLKYRDLGPTYIGTVAQALEDRRVDLVDVTYLFNTRLPTVERMLSEYHRTGGIE